MALKPGNPAEKKRFVVLDRDGTLIVERNFLANPNEIEFFPAAIEALKKFRELGLGIILITNQSGIGRGHFNQEQLRQVHDQLNHLLESEGIKLDGIYVCPHRPEDRCDCRKPNTGLMEQAVHEHSFDPVQSFVIGDKLSDIEFGKRAGATTILVRTGYGKQTEESGAVTPDQKVDGLSEAAAYIASLL